MSRRQFTGALVSAVWAWVPVHAYRDQRPPRGDARLTSRPTRSGSPAPPAAGVQPLGLGTTRDGVLFVPATVPPQGLPLLVLLHGAGGRGDRVVRRFLAFAEAAGVALLAPDSRGATWDAIGRAFGPDVQFLDRALARAFEILRVDPSRVAIGGFSDGASYALSVGLVNGDLFHTILAFSPGFYVGGPVTGRPRIFVSHGVTDEVLPIERCSSLIVPALTRQGYTVTFRRFAGGHEVPSDIAREGMTLVSAR